MTMTSQPLKFNCDLRIVNTIYFSLIKQKAHRNYKQILEGVLWSYVVVETEIHGEKNRLRAATNLPHTDTGIRSRGHRHSIPDRLSKMCVI